MQITKIEKRAYTLPVNVKDNVSIDGDFEEMAGESLFDDLIDDEAPGHVRLFQAVIFSDLRRKVETPQQFVSWLETKHAEIYCDIANLDRDYLKLLAIEYMSVV